MATNTERAMAELIDSMAVYHSIGLDAQDRSHFYDPDARQVVVCEGDRRGRGVSDDDIIRRIDIPEASTGAWDYVRFAREECGVEWVETDVPEEDPDR